MDDKDLGVTAGETVDETSVEQVEKNVVKQVDVNKQLEIVLTQLNKQYGQGSVVRLGSGNIKPWESISTGALNLDCHLGIGGLPKGRIVEIYGPESSGKSTLALTVVAKAQQQGLTCAYIDMEHALDPIYMDALGIDLDELLLAQPDYGEQALDIAFSLLTTGQLGVLVIDSVAALTPKAELEGDMEQAHMGLQARMMAKYMRKITALAAEHKTLVIFINQLREKIGIMFGNPETTPGGRALKFAASVRIDVRKKEEIKNSKTGEITGIVVKAKIVKNKMAPPMKICEYDIIYGEGIDEYAAMLEIGLNKNLFTKSGPWIKYNDQPFAQGKQAARDRIKETPELWEHIKMVAKT